MRHRASLLNRRPVPARGPILWIVSIAAVGRFACSSSPPLSAKATVAAARALAEDLLRRSPRRQVTVLTCCRLPAPLRWFLNDAYRWQLTRRALALRARCSACFGAALAASARSGRALARGLTRLLRLLRCIRPMSSCRPGPPRRRSSVAFASAARCACPCARRSPTSQASSSGRTRESTSIS